MGQTVGDAEEPVVGLHERRVGTRPFPINLVLGESAPDSFGQACRNMP